VAQIPGRIAELVENFDRNKGFFTSGRYNETQVRREFIDPFFEALGWDVTNTSGYAHAYKDVIHEDAIKVGGWTKAPDYCFRIGGARKFFVEAKKPSIDVKGDPHPAYQLRRYAWSAKLPLSILTDFEEFAAYDCRKRPEQTDKAAVARIMYCTYRDYIDQWEQIQGVFGKQAILKGSFDKFAATTRGKRGTGTVDAEFLGEIEKWREMLAKTIALRNTSLTRDQVNFAVQRTIDRILFLRMCEDRGIESYSQLLALSTGTDTYQRLCQLFRQADAKYNSGLFHFRPEKNRPETPDELTPNIIVDDTPLKWILHNLYFPQSPYEFSVLPAEILGNVYEQFLGKVIRLTGGHRAVVEEKPEVKKAGGVYYTPAYIVDYIVKNTVGKLCEAKTPKQISALKILDPACGSGSFLLGAYTYLLDYHRDWYVKHDPQKHKDKIYQGRGAQYFLTIAEKKRILLNNIFGVDIDSAAVEVTKLSLLLKVLEGENAETIGQTYKMFHERALPDLADNIKCGNSLIAPHFFDNLDPDSITDELRKRINAFDWKAEFPQIFNRKNPGFNAVIGNPPYGAFFDKGELLYLKAQFKVFNSIQDAYVAFIENAHKLLRTNGKFGYIIPSAWLGGPRYAHLRKYFLSFSIEAIILLPFDVFPDAYIDTAVITTTLSKPATGHQVITYEYPKREKISAIDTATLRCSHVSQSAWGKVDNLKFVLDGEMLSLLSSIAKRFAEPFEHVVEIKRGVLFDQSLLTDTKTCDNSHRYFQGDVYRYQTSFAAPMWVEYGPRMKEYPKEFKWFEGRRLLLRRLVNRQRRLMAVLVDETVITNKNLYTIRTTQAQSLEYILGILNSKLFSRLYLSQVTQATKDDFPQVTIRDIKTLPFRTIHFDKADDVARHAKMVNLVERMLDLHKKLAAAKVPDEKTRIQRQINAADKQIDSLVYELYNLTDEEIKIVEASQQ